MQRIAAGEARTRNPRSRVNHSITEPLRSLSCEKTTQGIFALFGRGPRAFQIGKINAVNP